MAGPVQTATSGIDDSNRDRPAFVLGQAVRVLEREGQNSPREGTVRQTIWHHKDGCWTYYLRCGSRDISKRYYAADLELLT